MDAPGVSIAGDGDTRGQRHPGWRSTSRYAAADHRRATLSTTGWTHGWPPCTPTEFTALLRRHRIPRRNQPGAITERFPTAAPVTEAFLREAYLDIGLATTHIEQLTGQPDGTDPEPDACTRDTCSPSGLVTLVGPPAATEQDPEPALKARTANAHTASVTSSFRSQKYSTGGA
jgi:hypothetical protein